MFELLKDGANKLKAKIGGDELDEKLVEVVSEENWQASTQQLHEIASAAYNYEKWQKINEFIWQKLKKSKSWKKILKTFNLIQFLLKNGPPSIISNFKYDLYQLRTFENYSTYIDGLDKGQPIRERAKVVVNLLGNQELLEEERVKAKNIREKMANVVGGSSYSGGGYGNSNSNYGGNSGYGGSGYGGSGYGGSSKYDNQPKKKDNNNKAYDYGNGLGAYGDYNYNKSTLDKYKDAKNDKSTTNDKKQEKEKKAEVVVQTKKPFQKIASKLSKPGEKKQEKVEQVKQNNAVVGTASTPTTNNNAIIDIFGFDTPAATAPLQTNNTPFSFENNTAPKPAVQATQPLQQVQQTQQVVQPVQSPPIQYPGQPQSTQQPVVPQQNANQFQQLYQHQPLAQQMYPQQVGYNQFVQPNQFPQPNYQQYPNQYPQAQYNQFAPQPNQFAYQQAPFNPQQQYNPYAPPVQQNPVQLAPNNPYQQQPASNFNMGITLNAQTTKKQENTTKNPTSSTAQNVNWLSSTEKGLLDFSDFTSQVKKDTSSKQAAKTQINNNIQIDAWSW